MKTRWLLLSVLYIFLFIAGCQGVQNGVKYYDACKGDADCLALMNQKAKEAEIVTSTALDSMGFSPVAQTVGAGVGMFVSLLSGILLGRNKFKKL